MAGKGRPPLDPGTYGKITVTPLAPTRDGKPRYKARARFRPRIGDTVSVVKTGQTKADAERRLKLALTDRRTSGGTGITTRSKISDLARVWLEEIDGSERSDSTKEQYGYFVDRYVHPTLGGFRIGEVTTSVCDRALGVIIETSGVGAAKSAKAVLNGMFRLAVRYDAALVNPVRETRAVPRNRAHATALTLEEATDITDRLRTLPRAVELDVPDLVEFLLGTGLRIGEALAVREDVLDTDAATVEINATLIRTKRKGLHVQERPKTAAGWRVLALPPFLIDMVQRRRGELRLHDDHGALFPSPFARSLRDPSNAAGDLREVLRALDPEADGYGWVHFHTFRKTVATRLDEAGWTARQIADQLGHSRPSMTLDVYLGRKVVNAEAATALDRK